MQKRHLRYPPDCVLVSDLHERQYDGYTQLVAIVHDEQLEMQSDSVPDTSPNAYAGQTIMVTKYFKVQRVRFLMTRCMDATINELQHQYDTERANHEKTQIQLQEDHRNLEKALKTCKTQASELEEASKKVDRLFKEAKDSEHKAQEATQMHKKVLDKLKACRKAIGELQWKELFPDGD